MKSARCVLMMGLTATAALLAGPAAAQTVIGPNQHFIGFVNGSSNAAVVKTVCPGPATPGRKGSVAGGQTLSVAKVSGGMGNTGLFSQVFAWFVPTANGHTPTQLTFTHYGRPRTIPTSVRVPCVGHGTVEFSSCPYLAPCAADWVPAYVKVRFVNIAA
jgi:hypothetical protein